MSFVTSVTSVYTNLRPTEFYSRYSVA